MENSCPGNGREDGPWLYRLSDTRATKERFVSHATNELVFEERWMHSTSAHHLPEKWTGETIFDYKPEEEVQKPETMQAVVPRRHDEVHNTIQEKGDRWTKEGQEWTRHHVEHRTLLYQPRLSADGPPHYLSRTIGEIRPGQPWQ